MSPSRLRANSVYEHTTRADTQNHPPAAPLPCRLSHGPVKIVLEDDAEEHVESDSEDEEEGSGASRRRQQQLWRSHQERASWHECTIKAGTSARLAYCAAALQLTAAKPLEALARASGKRK